MPPTNEKTIFIMNDRRHLDADHSVSPKSSRSCWTCKVRRKKCDGEFPICHACAALQIPCYISQAKPEWMDGGSRQEGMAEWLKMKVKENAHRRRAKRAVATSSNPDSPSAAEGSPANGEWIILKQPATMNDVTSPNYSDDLESELIPLSEPAATESGDKKSHCPVARKVDIPSAAFSRADTILMNFYLESVFPFLFPFHQPSILQGGKAWMLELMLKSPVMWQATTCQCSYYLSLAQETTDHDDAWEVVVAESRDAFQVLGQALQVLDGPALSEHMHGAVRVLTSIMQLQRFEIAVMSFSNCRAHLSASISLFRQLLESADVADGACPRSRFNAVISSLGPSWMIPGQSVRVPSAEQAAFRFSSALVVFDDVIASTALQEPPRLYDLHSSLLESETGVDIKSTVGCENWIMLQIGRIATLDAWKQQCKRAGNLDVVELVQRAVSIKNSIENEFKRLEASQAAYPQEDNTLLDILSPGHIRKAGTSTAQYQSLLVTMIWAHAAILYLSVVVSGWQPANDEVRSHVRVTAGLLTELSPRTLLRAVCWPLCVAGCVADPGEQGQFRDLVQALQPVSVFGTLHRALEIMETVWSTRMSATAADYDFAACFRSKDDIVLLV